MGNFSDPSSKREKSSNFFVIIIITIPLFFFFTGSADAFLKKKPREATLPPADLSQTAPYRIFYNFEPLSQDHSSAKSTQRFVELHYKIADMTEPPGSLFRDSKGGKVEFLDSDGFVLASDYFLKEDFDKSDLYRSFWVEKKRVVKIVQARALPLRPGEMEILKRERQAQEEEKKKEDALYALKLAEATVLEPKPLPRSSDVIEEKTKMDSKTGEIVTPGRDDQETVPSPEFPQTQSEKNEETAVTPIPDSIQPSSAPPELIRPDPQTADPPAAVPPVSEKPLEAVPSQEPIPVKTAEIIPEPLPVTSATAESPVIAEALPMEEADAKPENSVTASDSQAKIKPKQDENALLDLGGVQNEDVKNVLSEIENNPPTEVEVSPSTLPDFESPEELKENS